MKKTLIIIFVVFCSSCINRKSLFNQQETLNTTKQEVVSANVEVKQPMPQPLTVNFATGSNTTLSDVSILLVPTIPPPSATFSNTSTSSGNVGVEQKVDIVERKEQTNPFTLLLWGLGSLSILLVLFVVWSVVRNSIVGRLVAASYSGGERALGSMFEHISEKRKNNLDSNKDMLYREIEEAIISKQKSLLQKKTEKK